MKRRSVLVPVFSASIALTLNLFTCHAEDIYLCKVSDVMKDSSFQALPRSEYDTLVKRIRTEGFCFTKAHQLAEKAWKEGGKEGRYPGRGLSKRRVTKMKSYRSKEEADAKIADMEASAKSSAEKKKKNAERMKKQMSNNNKGRNNRGGGGGGGNNQMMQSMMKSRQRKESRDKEKREVLSEAKDIFLEQLNKLVDEKMQPRNTGAES